MSESFIKPPLTTSEELKAEESRLKEILRMKRTQIQQDLKSLKAEFKPVLTIAKIIGDLTSADHNRNRIAHAGTNLTIDMIARMIFPRGNFLLKTLLPKLVKNYTSNYVDKVVDKAAPALRRFGTRLTESAKKG
jgi:hypothetical protein